MAAREAAANPTRREGAGPLYLEFDRNNQDHVKLTSEAFNAFGVELTGDRYYADPEDNRRLQFAVARMKELRTFFDIAHFDDDAPAGKDGNDGSSESSQGSVVPGETSADHLACPEDAYDKVVAACQIDPDAPKVYTPLGWCKSPPSASATEPCMLRYVEQFNSR